MDNWDDDMYAYRTPDGTTTFSSNSSTTTTEFNHYFLSYPLSHINKTNHETGNKIIMPASALNQLASLSVSYPMLFRIENATAGLHSHCGVIEFTADEGFVFMPTWMMNTMQIQQGDLVNIINTSLPKGEYIKIQPHETNFTALSDHKSLLEKTFRDFVSLTTGDTILVTHGDQKYLVDIVETKPSPAILLFETDCEVDFALPLDYKEPERKTFPADDGDTTKKDSKVLFPGTGKRLGGTHAQRNDNNVSNDLQMMKKLKTITESTTVVDGQVEKKQEKKFKAFTGLARWVDGQLLVAVTADDHGMVRSTIQENIQGGFVAFTGKSYRLL